MLTDPLPSSVDLSWLPLGAGDNTHCVRVNGWLFERVAALRARREPCDLYHAALEVVLDGRRSVIEMTPVWGTDAPDRGVVCEGPVGARWWGRSRLFRYEVRCWRDGVIPDLAQAVDSPQRLSSDREQAALVVAQLRRGTPHTFRELIAGADRKGVIVARFVAVLELYRFAAVAFEQLEPLGELTIRWVADAWSDENLANLGADYG